MRIVAFSDSHGNSGLLREAVLTALESGNIDVCVHCGDGARDMDAIEDILRVENPNVRIYTVRGNCDLGALHVPLMESFEVNGVRVIATHGHAYQVKSHYSALLAAAESQQAKVAFFGHTHKPFLEAVHGLYLINPGAVCTHMVGNVAYAQVSIHTDGKIRADLMNWLR